MFEKVLSTPLSCDFLSSNNFVCSGLLWVNPFYATGFVLYRKHKKTSGFLMFSECIERDQQHEMCRKRVQVHTFIIYTFQFGKTT